MQLSIHLLVVAVSDGNKNMIYVLNIEVWHVEQRQFLVLAQIDDAL